MYSKENASIRISLLLVLFLVAGCKSVPRDIVYSSNITEMPIVESDYYENPVKYPINHEHPYRETIETICREAVSEGVPGVIVLIDTPSDGTWVSAKGMIDVKNDVPMKDSSLSRIGSISKIFTAIVILELMEQEYLSLDDRISTHINSKFINHIANYKEITIRQLLGHTSGIPNYTDYLDVPRLYSENSNEDQSSLMALRKISDMPPVFQPGTACHYSNTNYILLGLIAENITKKKMKTLYEEMIFSRLGMRSTYFDVDKPVKSGLARGYVLFPKGGLIDTTDFDQATRTPDGGIVSNVYDMTNFIRNLFQDTGLISRDICMKMICDFTVNEKMGCDVGLGILKTRLPHGFDAYGYSGGHLGYTAELWHIPQSNTTFAYLINGSSFFGAHVNPIKKVKQKMFTMIDEYVPK